LMFRKSIELVLGGTPEGPPPGVVQLRKTTPCGRPWACHPFNSPSDSQ
jgi:hypothetical protein